ncbi:MBL fold metallo-hydrolase [Enterovirga sp. CN4-39]|uniref:MBL fold metallo-hydrolase n=1 Tax=Enterovirga sp. CN4-39 TaxID=3400910 RepID=UPI003BFE3D4B
MTRYTVGPATITRVEEMLGPGAPPDFLFAGFDPALFERVPLLKDQAFYDAAAGRVISSVHSWLIRLHGKTILVDTCSGNGRQRAPLFQRFGNLDTPYLQRLAEAGARPEDVDIVLLTHLHVDHAGWNTHWQDGAWRPTFPNARYLMSRAGLARWLPGGDGPAALPEHVAVWEDSIRPVVEAGLVDTIEPGDTIVPGLTVAAAPGHEPHQFVVRFEDGPRRFVCSADVLHQPIQIYAPHLNSCFCEDGETARATRARYLAEWAESGALILPVHFGYPHAGYIRRDGDGYAFEPAVPLA